MNFAEWENEQDQDCDHHWSKGWDLGSYPTLTCFGCGTFKRLDGLDELRKLERKLLRDSETYEKSTSSKASNLLEITQRKLGRVRELLEKLERPGASKIVELSPGAEQLPVELGAAATLTIPVKELVGKSDLFVFVPGSHFRPVERQFLLLNSCEERSTGLISIILVRSDGSFTDFLLVPSFKVDVQLPTELPTTKNLPTTATELPTTKNLPTTAVELSTTKNLPTTAVELPTTKNLPTTAVELPTTKNLPTTAVELPTTKTWEETRTNKSGFSYRILRWRDSDGKKRSKYLGKV